jgi:hypothetical protein
MTTNSNLQTTEEQKKKMTTNSSLQTIEEEKKNILLPLDNDFSDVHSWIRSLLFWNDTGKRGSPYFRRLRID